MPQGDHAGLWRPALLTLPVPIILWYIMFGLRPLNFWLEMSISTLGLSVLAFAVGGRILPRENFTPASVLLGIGSALILYFIFWMGDLISGYLFTFKNSQVLAIYANRAEASPVLVGLLLFLAIGPGEELYWRGLIQHAFSARFGPYPAWIITAVIYALVHIWSFNFMLIMAALVGGLFWGWLYLRTGSLGTVLISHAVWDVAIFILFPITHG
ncbi:MAG: CPBP family intramembrane metalloprotease [Firmicutes bacterium]|nr:CPBP family intramembrane metalloprotease [Bacillota bacterium]